MKVFLSYILLFWSIVVAGQNYQIITPGTDRFFITETDQIVGIRIKQTIPLINGNEYYNFSVLKEFNDNTVIEDCNYKINASWLGRKVIAQSDGLHILFNKNNDSIFINVSAIENDTWTFYTDSIGNYIEATVIHIIEDSVLYDIDSVKVISLQHKDSLGNNLQGNWNGAEIRLSNNYGWQKTFNVYEFPDSTTHYELTKYSIPTYTNIYNYTIGDTIQFYKRWNNYMISHEEYVTKIVLSKSTDTISGNISYMLYSDSLVFSYKPINTTFPYICCDTIVYRKTDTVNIEYENIGIFNTMPDEPIFINGDVITYKIQLENTHCLDRIVTQYFNYNVSYISDSCIEIIIDNESYYTKYVEGIGAFDFSISLGGSVNTTLNYFSGCNLNEFFTNTSKPFIKNDIRIYPNPVSSKLFISNSNTSTLIRIFNLHGKLVYENYYTDVIDVSEWHNGLYFVEINNNNIISTAKILVQH